MRVLVVSYAFPPVGGAGVQRVLKLVKYVSRCGVVPSVLTSRGASVPIVDASLEHDVPASAHIVRARTLEPSYSKKDLAWRASASPTTSLRARCARSAAKIARRLLVPDAQVLWLPAAGWALAKRLASPRADDVVFISGPPFSQFLLSAIARFRPGTAVVLDYRDEWMTTQTMYEMSGARGAVESLERAALRRAHVVTTATEEFRTALLERHPFLEGDRVIAIPNGFDPEDFPVELPQPPVDRFVLSYVGTVFRLTSARGLMEGLRLFHGREPELARLLEVRFVGRIVPTEAVHFDGSEALGVRRLGYLEHARAIEELARSHVALCLLDDVSGVERIYPAKIFEIMHLGRPCLALAPEGALANLVRRCQAGEVVAPRDAEAIASALERSVSRFRAGLAPPRSDPVDIERFDRRWQAGQFAEAFRLALGIARRTPLANGQPPVERGPSSASSA